MSKVIGIDLGTTNSCVSVVEAGAPVVITNRSGYKTTPSVVAVMDSGRRLVGRMAKRQAITNARQTVHAAKRLIGQRWGEPEVLRTMENLSYEVVEGPSGDVRIRLQGRDFSVPEVSSMILQELKLVADEYLGEEATKAVITVPAYFNDSQRQATKDAGRIAGLDVLQVVNEPTAAALAYGHGKDLKQNLVIFDLGGGTFDVSVVKINGEVFDVLATGGDSFLGGEDFDARIIEWLVMEFAMEHGVDLREDPMALQRLRDAAESAKVALSSESSHDVQLPFIFTPSGGQAVHLERRLTRESFEELVADLVHRSLRLSAEVVGETGLSIGDIDGVLLVGGMTRMPAIGAAVQSLFKRPPLRGVNPDEAVAIGAAILANTHAEERAVGMPQLNDVLPLSLGLMTYGGAFHVVLPKNSPVPGEARRRFTTSRDGQAAIKLVVCQGESTEAADNTMLGHFMLTGLRSAPAGQVDVEVVFSADVNGIIRVAARDLQTGLAQQIELQASSSLSEAEVDAMIASNEEYAIGLSREADEDGVRTLIHRRIREVESLMPSVRAMTAGNPMAGAALEMAETTVRASRVAARQGTMEEMQEMVSTLSEVHEVFSQIVA